MNDLPNKLSELISLAYEDAKQILRTPGYELNMDHWHRYSAYQWHGHSMHTIERDTCYVCLAGAVMANTLGAPREKDLSPDEMRIYVRDKLEALNEFRLLHLYIAVDYFYGLEVAEDHADNVEQIAARYENQPILYSRKTTDEELEAFFSHPMIIEFRQYLVDNGL